MTSGGFDDPATGWTGADVDARMSENLLGNGRADRVVETDDAGNQITVMQQVIDLPEATTTALTFDSLLRPKSNATADSQGFRVDILDRAGIGIASQTFPPSNTYRAYAMPVTFPEAGSYTLRLTELAPNMAVLEEDISLLAGFVEGTAIDTPDGPAPIESLQIGDLVSTQHGPRPIRWISEHQITPDDLAANSRLRPIKISAGALGQDLPRADLWVSPEHRMLIHTPLCRKLFDADHALIAAHHLTVLDGVEVDDSRKSIRYLHLFLDDHAILTAEGAPSESLLLDDPTWDSLTDEARAELRALCPDIDTDRSAPKTAAVIPISRQQKRLARRLAADLSADPPAETSDQALTNIAAE
ncbi:Hint domain-containing protein [Roseovarius nubinhibens]|uniref:Hint domain-containing protein n=1 Tax=Roseovarius nubinhibens TaxID=314263 RepID=UPI001C097317|nr:Hint domain-containing protein [Roseovarius nubinhibens]MBU2998212.1 Hint domain-containing protein [Roseovarius nubinhibens]